MRRQPPQPTAGDVGDGRLAARPGVITRANPAGLQSLGLVPRRDTLLYVPPTYDPQCAAPLAVLLHGAGGEAQGGLSLFQPFADEWGIISLAPASRGSTWDVIRGGWGQDVAVIDQALGQVFSRYNIDPAKIAIGGFSDGESYALSIGITNGDLLGHLIAFSPGFMAPADQRGAPRIYISHGTRDDVLPIDRCSRRLAPLLQRADYDVTYHEFDGPHVVPPDVARAAAVWFINGDRDRVSS